MYISQHICSRFRTGAAVARNVMVLTLLAISMSAVAQTAGPAALITAASQVTELNYADGNGADNVLQDKHIQLETGNRGEISIELNTPFIVQPSTPVVLSTTKGLVVYFARVSATGAPTAVKVQGHIADTPEDTYVDIGYAYLLFRGGTFNHEFSDRVYYKPVEAAGPTTTFDKFKLTVEKVSNGSVAKFGKFNLFQIDEGAPYPAGRVDPLHVANEYSLIFKDYSYKPTRGILDSRNWYGPNKTYYENVTTPPWGDNNSIEWNNVKLEFPTFKEQPNNENIATENTQMPHTYEHTLYAMPGDVISLNPFYDLPTSTQYAEKYSHWYGYNPQIDGTLQPQSYEHVKDEANHDLLDFLIDPAGIVRTDNAGFFAGTDVPRIVDQTTTINGATYYLIYDFKSLERFANQVNSGNIAASTHAILARDIDCSGGKICIGNAEHPYCGKFDGNAYTIRNIGSSLFGCIGDGAEISNLVVADAEIKIAEKDKATDSGIIVDRVSNSGTAEAPEVTISNIVVTGKIQNEQTLLKGGIIGQVEDGSAPIKITLDHVVFSGNVYTNNYENEAANKNPNGALIGELNSNKVELNGCYVKANVDGHNVPAANGIGHANVQENITGVESCSILACNYNYKADTSIEIRETYLPELPGENNSHRVLVGYKPAGWGKFGVRIRPNSGDGSLFDFRECLRHDGSGLYYVHFKKDSKTDDWSNFIHPVVSGVTYNSNFWANIISVMPYDDKNKTNTRTQFPIIPEGYRDIYISPRLYVANPDYHPDTRCIPIPYMSRVDVGDYTGIVATNYPERWYGTEATFYQPLKTDYAPTDPLNLSLEKKDYYIAVDLGHQFSDEGNGYNVDHENKVIYEPVIAYRHIFHIKDGKTFADDYTATTEKNRAYVESHARSISARAGYDFQIRLTTQVPVENQTDAVPVMTNFYYKKGENSYARVPNVGIAVFDKNGNRYAPTQGPQFKFDATVATQGYRKNYPDAEYGFGDSQEQYFTGNGGGSVYRTLFCDSQTAQAGSYIVRLYAQEANGDPIYIGTTGELLYLDEYHVTFLPDVDVSVKPEAELYNEPENERKFYYHSPKYLSEELGDPAVKIDFDQYCQYENTDKYNLNDWFISSNESEVNADHYVKWPLPWNESTYSFGYGGHSKYDYNEYIITNNSSQGNFHSRSINDRLYFDTYNSSTGKSERGYFLYLNAASDPGTAASLKINALCPGSTICVSAWIAEVSTFPEVANICFNFIAVDNNGNREVVHSFVSGYIDNLNFGSSEARHKMSSNQSNEHRGEWMHVYYSFIPDISSIDNLSDIHHYELELENNCVSSSGADYGIDDIRAYIIAPQINAQQLGPICDANQKTTGIKISSRFDKLLSSVGLEPAKDGEEARELKLHFAVLDKEKYDNLYNGNNLAEAVAGSIFNINSENGSKWASVTISSRFESLPEYNENKEEEFDKAMGYKSKGNVEYFLLNVLPYDDDLCPGKEYYIVLYEESNGLAAPSADHYEIFGITGNPCEKYCTVQLQGSGIFKVDGYAYTNDDPVQVCVGQSPVVQVELKMALKNADQPLPPAYKDFLDAPEHYYDWYRGSIKEFMKKRLSNNTVSYYDLLSEFRTTDTDATELPALAPGATEDKYSPLRSLVESNTLVLHASSFVFPPITDPEDDHILTLTALPILPILDSNPSDEDTENTDEDEQEEGEEDAIDISNYTLCSQPNEVHLYVLSAAPTMYDGFADIPYGTLADVPLRVGYTQLNGISGLGRVTEPKENALGILPDIAIPQDIKCLELPLRDITSYQGKEANATMSINLNENETGDPFVYLVATNDPAYIGLNKHPADRVAIQNGLLPIGMVNTLEANTDAGHKNYVTIAFSKQMQFSEGYYYTVRFTYNEMLNTMVSGYCRGHLVFTLKVVPEYMKWTGADSRNWNNDANWSRVIAGELLLPANDSKIANHTIVSKKTMRYDLAVKKSLPVPGTAMSYAPMDFTKVIVPNLYDDANNNSVTESSKGYPVMFTASSTSIAGFDWNNSATSADDSKVGAATENIVFDMASLNATDKLACRPWYANTCKEIHFNHGAEILKQQHFHFGSNYEKAWVDVEMKGNLWYLLGSPLKYVVAGDMYTKPESYSQDTELFTDITFNPTDYGRYKVPVYQRGWNKATTKTYELGKSGYNDNAVEALNWSRVYNDVEEDYSPGIGFSIRTATPSNEQTVMFRLPKADDNYSYYTHDYTPKNPDGTDNTEGTGHLTPINRNNDEGEDERHSLIDFSSSTDSYQSAVAVGGDEGGNFFLVGNPFMAHMDMATFFSQNPGLFPSYWLMTENRQIAVMWSEQSGTYMSTETTGEGSTGLIAPLQGFFVKSTTKANTLNLKFTPEMITEPAAQPALQSLSRSGNRSTLISVSALDADNNVASRTLLNIDADAKADYDGSEDASLLIDQTLESRATVYSVASGQALAINSLNDISETEIGLITAKDASTKLLFEGIDDMEDLFLLDTTTGEFTEMHEGMSVDVKGSASGRFYITRKTANRMEPAPAVLLKGRTVSAVSPTNGITVRVYTSVGQYVGEWTSGSTRVQFDLDRGAYIVEAVSDNQKVSRKFIVN